MGPPPVVTGISPKEGPPGTRVTIRGEFLGVSATDMIGLKICGCDCLLSAEWKSKNKIVARSGPCRGRGDIIVSTKSGGEGTSTVQFRGYHESVGPVKESAVWVEETAPPSLPWGRRPMSPAAYTPPDPLGLSTEGDEAKFPEEVLHELFPDGSGNLADENFEPGWYLLEHHSNTSYEDLKAGMVFLQRKVEGQKEGQMSFLKANTGAVMDQLDRLVLLKNMFEEDHRRTGKEPLPSLQEAIEGSITLADSLFSEILSRKEGAERTREALAQLTRHRLLFQLPAAMDGNIRRQEYELVVNDYTRVKNLFGNTEVKLFQKILGDIDKKIDDLKETLHNRIKAMPVSIQDQRKFIRLLMSLNWDGDAAWTAIASRKDYLMKIMNKVRDHFRQKEDLEASEKGKRKAKEETEGEWGAVRELWCGAACGLLSEELAALWTLAKWYFAGELGGNPGAPQRHDEFKQMIIASVEVFSEQMRACLLTGNGAATADSVRGRLVANLRHLREAYDSLLKLDLPSQPLSIVERVIFDYRVHGMTAFLQRALRRVRTLGDKETWKIEEFSDYGAITNLPHELESCVGEALSSISKCVAAGGRREAALLGGGGGGEPVALLHRHTQQLLLAFSAALQALALKHSNQDFNNSSLSQTLVQNLDDTLPLRTGADGGGASWQQRLLIAGANAQYTRRVTLNNIANAFESYDFPKPALALQAAKDDLTTLEATIAETYLEHKGDPLVGTIEPSMYMGRHRLEPDSVIEDARPYVYEIINNLIAVHAEVDSVCGSASTRYVRDICETVCEELARLAAYEEKAHRKRLEDLAKGEETALHEERARWRAAAFQSRLEYRLLRAACHSHLTRKAESHLVEAMACISPLDNDEDKKRMETLVNGLTKRMKLQLESLNCNMETV